MEDLVIEKCFDGIYKNKTVLVTGHTGFKGSWLTLWLKELGASVIGYSLEPNTDPSLFNILNLEKDIISIIGDIRDEEKITEVIKIYKPEIVFHMAAQPIVRLSYDKPKLTYETNVVGTLNLFEAIRKSDSTKAIVNITTDKCYENRETYYGYRETDSLGGYDPYSSSKACSEILSSSYRKSYFNKMNIGLATARSGNVIGGGDWSRDRLLPDIVRKIFNDSQVVIRNPLSIRPWQYVLEPISGYLTLGTLVLKDNIKYSQSWNFGPNDYDTLNVEEIAKLSIEIIGKGSYELQYEDKVHEASLLKLDISKVVTELNWKPIYDINQAVTKTIEWYKNYYNEDTDMKKYSINQIKEYTNNSIRHKIIGKYK